MCSSHQPDKFICPSTEVFGTASFIWGVIGPARQFSKGQLYYALTFFFLIGAVAPIITYTLMKRFPNSIARYINAPVIFTGIAWSESLPRNIASFTSDFRLQSRLPLRSTTCLGLLSVSSSSMSSVAATSPGGRSITVSPVRYICVLGILSCLNLDVLSAAMDSGVAVSIVLIFFCLQYPANGSIGVNTILTWWGNTVFANTADANGVTLKTVGVNETFGPSHW